MLVDKTPVMFSLPGIEGEGAEQRLAIPVLSTPVLLHQTLSTPVLIPQTWPLLEQSSEGDVVLAGGQTEGRQQEAGEQELGEIS